MDNQEKQIGDEYIMPNACPKCRSDLKISHGVSEICSNWQHPHFSEMYEEGGLRNCDYGLLAG